jgi:serine/threonine protein kinase
MKEYLYNNELKKANIERKISNINYETKGDIIINKLDLLDITKLKEYCGKNSFLLEKYELLSYVDLGSESIVYKCLDKSTKKKYISKIIFNKKREKIKSELIISSKLKNKNVINFYSYSHIVKDESWCIIMEDAKYGNLTNFKNKVLKRLSLSESLICYIAYQILNGLIYCHQCKIAHMDVKTKNVVIDEYLNTKLIDFSISIDYRDKKLSEEIRLPLLGTSFYMPLEVIASQKVKYKDLHKIDLYSFGVILYYLAFGRYPYNLTHNDEDDYTKICQKIFINNIGFNEKQYSFSTYFLDFLNKLLEKDINKRINLIEAKNHFWIKGAELLLDEKEKLNNINLFIYHVLTDHIKQFNEYIGKYN